MATNCLSPGATTLFTNLLASTGDEFDDDKILRDKVGLITPWAAEYQYGRESSLICIEFPSNLFGSSFKEVALHFYREYAACLVGLESVGGESAQDENSNGCTLFPKGHVIEKGDVGFVIVPSKKWKMMKAAGDLRHLSEDEFKERLNDFAEFPETIGRNIESENLPIETAPYMETQVQEGLRQRKSNVTLETTAPSPSVKTPPPGRVKGRRPSLQGDDPIAIADIGKLQIKKLSETVAKKRVQRRQVLQDLFQNDYNRNANAFIRDIYHIYGHPDPRSAISTYDTKDDDDDMVDDMFSDDMFTSVEALMDSGGSAEIEHQPMVLVCGYNPHLSYTVGTLVTEGYKVTVIAEKRGEEDWDAMMAQVEDNSVTFFKGNPMRLEALMEAGLLSATCVLILASQSVLNKTSDDLQDTDAILIHNLVKKAAPGTFVTTELIESDSVKYIHNDDEEGHFIEIDGTNRNVKDFLPYSTGQLFSALIFNLFMSKVHRRLTVLTLFEQLIYGTQDPNDSAKLKRSLKVEPIPTEFIGALYQDLFTHLVEKGEVVPLGIFGLRGNTEPVVLTNPRPDTVMGADDRIYVVSQSN